MNSSSGWLCLARVDHFNRKLNPHSLCGLDCGEQVPCAAADFKHALPGADEEAIDLFEPAVIPTAHAVPVITLESYGIPVGLALFCKILTRQGCVWLFVF